eukprot:931886-Rhodomonas_salina.1
MGTQLCKPLRWGEEALATLAERNHYAANNELAEKKFGHSSFAHSTTSTTTTTGSLGPRVPGSPWGTLVPGGRNS